MFPCTPLPCVWQANAREEHSPALTATCTHSPLPESPHWMGPLYPPGHLLTLKTLPGTTWIIFLGGPRQEHIANAHYVEGLPMRDPNTLIPLVQRLYIYLGLHKTKFSASKPSSTRLCCTTQATERSLCRVWNVPWICSCF